MSSSSQVSTGAEPRFHGLSSATRLGMGLDGEDGPDIDLDTLIVERGDEPGEGWIYFRGEDEEDEPGEGGRTL